MKYHDGKKDFIYTRLKREPYAEMKDAHYHPYYEFYYLTSGKRKFFIADTIFTVNKGDLIIIPKGTIHRTTYMSNEIHERCTINFSDKFIENFNSPASAKDLEENLRYCKITIPSTRREYIENLFSKIEREYSGVDHFSESMIKTHLYELCVFVLRCLERNYDKSENVEIEDEIITMAAQYISSNYMNTITLEALAEKYNMSPSYFSRKFKNCTGFGFKEYLSTIRINQACNMLIQTNKSITEIAEECGFGDSNYFGDSFKKAKGMSPRSYRKAKELM